MKALLGICMYMADIPVVLWLYYRCLEREPLVWKKGRYPLLLLHGLLGICCTVEFLGKGPAGGVLSALPGLLILEGFFLANILWAKKGVGAFVKTGIFLGVFRLISLGIPLAVKKLTVEKLTTIPVGADYMPAAAAAALAVLLGFFLLALVLNRRLYEKISAHFWNGAAGLLFMTLLVYELYRLAFSEERELFFGAVLLLLTGAFLTLIGCQKRALRGEAFYFRTQRRIFDDYSVALDRQNTIVRQISHDIGNYLTEMKNLSKAEDTEGMDAVTWKLQNEYGQLAFVEYSNNRLVNAILHRKLEVCRAKKIRTQVDFSQFDGGFVENTDWLEIFFCLFDNAIEACSALERGRERFIKVKAKCSGGFEVIVFLNSKQPGEKSENGRRTTKGSTYEYGMGLHILEVIVKKYGGTVICKEEEDTFQTTVSLQVRDKRRERMV